VKKFHGRTVVLLVVAAMAVSCMLTATFLDQSRYTISDAVKPESRADRETGVKGASDEGTSDQSGFTSSEWRKLELVYQMLESSYYEEFDREKLLDGAIRGMVSALGDPYTTYMNAEEAEQFTASVDSTFSGIGAEVTMLEGQVTVVSALKDSPAERAGIMAKDIIVSVNQESLTGLTLNEAVAKIRGPKGTQAKLGILREGYEGVLEIVVVRDDIDVETVFSRMVAPGIGLIELRQFVQNSDQRFMEELEQLRKQGMQGLIIDVRNNPGGYLYSVIDLLDHLLSEGQTIVQVENRGGETQVTAATGSGIDLPITVLINEGSASASEILAAALQENGRAKLFGMQTFGKGTVQSTYTKGFKDGSNMKITIAKWLTPKGNFINGVGVKPDVEVRLPDYFNVMSLPKDQVFEEEQNLAAIANLQLMLNAIGYETDRTDGYYSAKTTEAVKQFQADHGLPVTGKTDADTAQKLEDAVISLIRDPANDTQLQAAVEYLRQMLGIDS
jgi:carboxyl-terminal processing protease